MKEREEQLSHVQRLQAVGTLAAGVAHEFNNALGGMTGFVYLLNKAETVGGKEYRYLHRMQGLIDSSAMMIRQLLTFSGKHRTSMETIEISSFIHSLFPLLRIAAPQTKLVENINPSSCYVNADSGLLQQAIINLVMNAHDALVEAGTKKPCIEFSLLLVNGEDERSWVKIIVSDNGPGISKEVMKNIFDLFFPTKKVGKGTGLGLAMVHGCAELHGGIVEVSSEQGDGAIFALVLPVSSET